MIQLREDLALDFEPRLHAAGGRATVHHFDGHLLFEFGIRALGEENLSHTADTQSAQYPVLSDTVSCHRQEHAPRRG
jgi:predicted component of type VI protein secretion system